MNIKFSLIFISVIFLVGTVSAADAHLFTNITDDVIFNLSNEGNAYLTQSFFGGGDVSSPTYSWLSDIDSGMFSLLADKIGWGLGGVTKLTLDGVSLNVSSDLDICISSGNCLSAMSGGGGSPWVSTADYIYNTTASVGIGTASPAKQLVISKTTGTADMQLIGSGANAIHQTATEYDIVYSRNTGTATIDIQAKPLDTTSGANYRFGLASGSTGENLIYLFDSNSSTVKTIIGTNGVIFNENSEDNDFRIEMSESCRSYMVKYNENAKNSFTKSINSFVEGL